MNPSQGLMPRLRLLHRMLECGSLDAPWVAVVWGAALAQAAGHRLAWADLTILFCATWLAYVADRLWECRPGHSVPSTFRHEFHARHFTTLLRLWLAGLLLSVIVAWLVLPLWKFLTGWIGVALVVLYLGCLNLEMPRGRKILIKRTAVPVLFAAGTGLMAEAWRQPEGWFSCLILAAGAAANVLLISLQEGRPEPEPVYLPRLVGVSLLVVFGLGQAGLILYLPAGLSALLFALVGFILLVRIQAAGLSLIRAATDAGLLIAGLLFLALA